MQARTLKCACVVRLAVLRFCQHHRKNMACQSHWSQEDTLVPGRGWETCGAHSSWPQRCKRNKCYFFYIPHLWLLCRNVVSILDQYRVPNSSESCSPSPNLSPFMSEWGRGRLVNEGLFEQNRWRCCLIPHAHLLLRELPLQDFPGGPVGKTLCFLCRGHGFDPWLEN